MSLRHDITLALLMLILRAAIYATADDDTHMVTIIGCHYHVI